jgi:hypothetical protein
LMTIGSRSAATALLAARAAPVMMLESFMPTRSVCDMCV